MVENIKEIGKTESNMERVSFSIPKTEYGKKEYGARGEELNGKMLMPMLNKYFFKI